MAQTNLGLAVEGIVERLMVLEKLALPATCDSVPYFFHEQASWPYWTHRHEGLSPTNTADTAVSGFRLELVARLVFGHLSSDFEGLLQTNSAVDVADVVAFFTAHRMLAVPDATDITLRKPPRWLAPQGITLSAGPLGPQAFSARLWHVGVEFRFSVPLIAGTERV